jgi:phosphoribosylformimino-5-aminoimidazole carboxamide ribotide isomerase
MRILPAIDILNAQCVRLKQGDYSKETVYAKNPIDIAKYWKDCGAEMIHVVDLDGAKVKNPVNCEIVIEIIRNVNIPVEIGGGIRTEESIQNYIDNGVERVVIGTLALKNPDWFCRMCDKFPHKLVLGIDAINGFVVTEGWRETSKTSAIELAKQFDGLKIPTIIYTDISKDGMLSGANFDEIIAIRDAVSIPITASGGVTSIDDIQKLKLLNIKECIIGKALYEKKFTLQDAIKTAQNTTTM